MRAWISWYCTICELRKFVSTNFRLTKKKRKYKLFRDISTRGAKQSAVWTYSTSKRRKKGERCARTSRTSPFLFHERLSVTIARVLDLPLSPSLSLVSPLVRPSSASSRSLLPLFRLAFSFPLFLYHVFFFALTLMYLRLPNR